MSTLDFDNIILSVADLFFVSKLKTALENQQCTVRLAPHESEIQKAVKIDPPDLIILDLENSQNDPKAIIQSIREEDRSEEIPILAFTNHTKLLAWEEKLKDQKTVVVSNNFISTYISDVVGLKRLFDKNQEDLLGNQ